MTWMKNTKGEVTDVAEEAVEVLKKKGWELTEAPAEASSTPAPAPDTHGAQQSLAPSSGNSTVPVEPDFKTLDPGKHEGKITGIVDRPFVKDNKTIIYKDVQILSGDTEVKAGYPLPVRPSSMLGKLLERFGATVVPGLPLDLDAILIGRKVEFQCTTKETDRGTFANVDRDTLKPKADDAAPSAKEGKK